MSWKILVVNKIPSDNNLDMQYVKLEITMKINKKNIFSHVLSDRSPIKIQQTSLTPAHISRLFCFLMCSLIKNSYALWNMIDSIFWGRKNLIWTLNILLSPEGRILSRMPGERWLILKRQKEPY